MRPARPAAEPAAARLAAPVKLAGLVATGDPVPTAVGEAGMTAGVVAGMTTPGAVVTGTVELT